MGWDGEVPIEYNWYALWVSHIPRWHLIAMLQKWYSQLRFPRERIEAAPPIYECLKMSFLALGALLFLVAGCGLLSTPQSQLPGLVRKISGQSPFVNSVVWSPDGNKIAVGSTIRPIPIWDVASVRDSHQLGESGAKAEGLAWSPNDI